MPTSTVRTIADANGALDMLEGMTAQSLAQPFIDWLDQLGDVQANVDAVLFPLGVDPDVNGRATRLRAMLAEAADLVEHTAGSCLMAGDLHAAVPVRAFFEHATFAVHLRRELCSVNIPTAETAATACEYTARLAWFSVAATTGICGAPSASSSNSTHKATAASSLLRQSTATTWWSLRWMVVETLRTIPQVRRPGAPSDRPREVLAETDGRGPEGGLHPVRG